MIRVIETEYAGILFRSRLEARWAVFFDAMGIEWEYEPERFEVVKHDRCEWVDLGTPGEYPGIWTHEYCETASYLPDFLLTQCGTWVEVKGDVNRLDTGLLHHAAMQLPRMNKAYEYGPNLLLLGSIPKPRMTGLFEPGDYGWKAFARCHHFDSPTEDATEGYRGADCYSHYVGTGSGGYMCRGLGAEEDYPSTLGYWHKNKRPWLAMETDIEVKGVDPLTPDYCVGDICNLSMDAYQKARSARFEQGESGALTRIGRR